MKSEKKKAVRFFADKFVCSIKDIFENVKKTNKKYKNILIEFQDSLKDVSRWSHTKKVDFAQSMTNPYMNFTTDDIYEYFLDVVRMVWKEAFLLDEKGKTKLQIQNNFLRLDTICVSCATDMINSEEPVVIVEETHFDPYDHKETYDNYSNVNNVDDDVERDEDDDVERDEDEDEERDEDEDEDDECEDIVEKDVEVDDTAYEEDTEKYDKDEIKTVTVYEDESESNSSEVESDEGSINFNINECVDTNHHNITDNKHENDVLSYVSSSESELDDNYIQQPKTNNDIPVTKTSNDIKIVTINERLVNQKKAIKKKLFSDHNTTYPHRSHKNSFF